MTTHSEESLTYQQAGVDIDRGALLVERIKPAVAGTRRPGVIGGLGGFGGLFDLVAAGYADPLLVSSTDGVGTKLKLAIDWARHETIGIDLVGMCVNDVVVQGAEPLFFLDYFATGALDLSTAQTVIDGIARGCAIAGASLLGGETAEMPGMYARGHYDLAGFCVGAVERRRLIDGRAIAAGDTVLGLGSSGLHSNGYSLVRRVLETHGVGPLDKLGERTIGDELLAPTKIYVKPLLDVFAHCEVKGLAHITGGGIVGNLPRILPPDVAAEIDLGSWPLPPVFAWLMATGPIGQSEMLRTFNCGIGMIAVVAPAVVGIIRTRLEDRGESVFEIGRIAARGERDSVVLRGSLG